MSAPPLTPATAVEPELRAAQRWNIVWVVPILALLLGGWMIYKNLSSQGPVARIGFETADGITAGKTDIRCRSVRVGVVKDVKLANDLNSVVVYLELDPDCEPLLRNGTHFWVVRPRVSTTDISGLGTLLTGAYIELDPGPENSGRCSDFKGLETPPATNRSIPGRRLTLTAQEAGSLVAGSPIYYRGFEVGRIESRHLDEGGMNVIYDAFIREEYSELVRENTKFWNTSGIDISAGSDGFKVRTPSFQAMVSGGATFGVPDDVLPGNPCSDGMTFELFRNQSEADKSAFNPTMKFLLLFDMSVRGLEKGAPVEFRGIVIGRVADISLDYVPDATDSRIPVLVEIDPSLLKRENPGKASDPDPDFIKKSVAKGLRASLKTGNLLTGALFVDFDYYQNSTYVELAQVGDYETLPTVSGGLAQLEAKITAIADKLQALPLKETMNTFNLAAEDARGAIKEIELVAAAARKTLDDPGFRNLPESLRGTLAQLEKSAASAGPDGALQGDLLRTLDELRASLRSMKSLTTSIDEKPNSLLFGRDGSSGESAPKAPRVKR